MENFASLFKKCRIESGLTLRKFCSESGADPSNWSKVERGILEPPKSRDLIEKYGRVINLSDDQIRELQDLAIYESIPKELLNEEITEKLPIFFRTISGKKPSREELEKLIKILTKA